MPSLNAPCLFYMRCPNDISSLINVGDRNFCERRNAALLGLPFACTIEYRILIIEGTEASDQKANVITNQMNKRRIAVFETKSIGFISTVIA